MAGSRARTQPDARTGVSAASAEALIRQRVSAYGIVLDRRIARRRRRRRWLLLVALAAIACVIALAVDAPRSAISRPVAPSTSAVVARSGSVTLIRFRLALDRCFAIVEKGTPLARACGVPDGGDQLTVFRSPPRARRTIVAGLAPRAARRLVITAGGRRRSLRLADGRAFVVRTAAVAVRATAVGRRGRVLAEARLPAL
jgi:hypothetical protein